MRSTFAAAIATALAVLAPAISRAQDAPPVPSGFLCEYGNQNSTTHLCELGYRQNWLSELGAAYYNGTPCYSNLSAFEDNRYWGINHSGNGLAYIYFIAENTFGSDSDPNAQYGVSPCTWVLSLTSPYFQPNTQIAQAVQLQCVGGSSWNGAACICPVVNSAQTYWNGDPWGNNGTCAAASMVQGGAAAQFNPPCVSGNVTDGHATFVANNNSATISVGTGSFFPDTSQSVVMDQLQNHIYIRWMRSYNRLTGQSLMWGTANNLNLQEGYQVYVVGGGCSNSGAYSAQVQ